MVNTYQNEGKDGTYQIVKAIPMTEDGNDVTSTNPLSTAETIGGRTQTYEDTSFVSGDSPVTHDVNTDLGRNAKSGYITCDGPGSILVEISDDGTNYGGQHTIKVEDTLSLDKLNIDSIRITHSGTDSAYRILVV
jgi:hypothetical protein